MKILNKGTEAMSLFKGDEMGNPSNNKGMKYKKNIHETSVDDNIMTVQEVAELLHFHEITILKCLHSGKIPGIKIGSVWRIWKPNLMKLLEPMDGPGTYY